MIEFEFVKAVCDDLNKREITRDQAIIILAMHDENREHKNTRHACFCHADTVQTISLLAEFIDILAKQHDEDPAKFVEMIAIALDVYNSDYESGSSDNKYI